MLKLRRIWILAILVSLLLNFVPTHSSASDCPQDWNISEPKLIINWNPSTKSYVSNLGHFLVYNSLPSGDPQSINFNSEFASSGRESKFIELFGSELLEKFKSEGGNVGLREALVIAPEFQDFSGLSSNKALNLFPSFWNNSSKSFNQVTPSLLLRRGTFINDIEGKTVKYFLEITKRGCAAPRTLTSNGVILPESNFPQTPIGLDTWSRGAESYLKSKFEKNLKRQVNWLTFESNLKKFRDVLTQLLELSRTEDPPFSVMAEMKPVTYLGEDDLQFVPYLMGIPTKNCLWDKLNESTFYLYLDREVILRSTPCKILAFAPDFQNASPELDYSKAWESLVVVEVIDIAAKPGSLSQKAKSTQIRYVENCVNQVINLFQKSSNPANRYNLTGLLSRFKISCRTSDSEAYRYGEDLLRAYAVEAEAKAKAEANANANAKAEAEATAGSTTAKSNKATIVCVKGKLIKKVIAVEPKCPKGYTRK